MPVEKLLGFDYGEKRIGVAFAQTITRSATPLDTLNSIHNKPDWKSIEDYIKEWAPDALIVGLPLNLDGSENEMTEKVKKFCRQLDGRFHIPVHTINESLTSYEAEQLLQKKKKINQQNKHEIDKIAAAIILETWLEHNT